MNGAGELVYIPQMLAAAEELEAVIPPISLLFIVELPAPKFEIAISAPFEEDVDVNEMLPVELILPIVLPVTLPMFTRPLSTVIHLNGEEEPVPFCEPVITIPVIVFPCMFEETVLPTIIDIGTKDVLAIPSRV